jgi:hypothetical protein
MKSFCKTVLLDLSSRCDERQQESCTGYCKLQGNCLPRSVAVLRYVLIVNPATAKKADKQHDDASDVELMTRLRRHGEETKIRRSCNETSKLRHGGVMAKRHRRPDDGRHLSTMTTPTTMNTRLKTIATTNDWKPSSMGHRRRRQHRVVVNFVVVVLLSASALSWHLNGAST